MWAACMRRGGRQPMPRWVCARAPVVFMAGRSRAVGCAATHNAQLHVISCVARWNVPGTLLHRTATSASCV